MRTLLLLTFLGGIATMSHAQNITAYRYWFDDDAGALVNVAVTAGQQFTLNTDLAAAAAGDGYNRITLQTQDDLGVWSVPLTKVFHRQGGDLTAWQYWFDDNISTEQTVNVPATSTLDVVTNIDCSALPTGSHLITWRDRDQIGYWSVPLTTEFSFTVGLQELPGVQSVLLFPNPAASELWLRIDASTDQDLTAEVLDASGRVVKQAPRIAVSSSSTIALDLSGLANGPYQVRIAGEQGIKCLPFFKQQ
ncbi:MAG: T9SS type A sorting domain-containing protein [Flavobacteriales bacterium]|nr:T9SS type A sorting domain-containing protein [Flavobacteriales bacterium]